MAYRHSLSTRATLIARAYNNPSFSYILRDHDRKQDSTDCTLSRREIHNFIQQRWSFGRSGLLNNNSYGSSAGSAFIRYMSTAVGEGGGSDKVELMKDVADFLSDATTTQMVVANHTPAVNEVAIAAADSFFPVAAQQHFIDLVHNLTGLNWWASIVLATLLIRSATFPLVISQRKVTSRLTFMRSHLEEIEQNLLYKDMDPEAVADYNKKLLMVYKEHGIFIQLTGLFIRGCVFFSFFPAILNMAEKVPSFKGGGAFWFTDLTTPDSFYILPILTALSFLIREFSLQERIEANPDAGTLKKLKMMKMILRGFAVLSIPSTMYFPKAICFYLITSNLFSLGLLLGLKVPGFRKALGAS